MPSELPRRRLKTVCKELNKACIHLQPVQHATLLLRMPQRAIHGFGSGCVGSSVLLQQVEYADVCVSVPWGSMRHWLLCSGLARSCFVILRPGNLHQGDDCVMSDFLADQAAKGFPVSHPSDSITIQLRDLHTAPHVACRHAQERNQQVSTFTVVRPETLMTEQESSHDQSAHSC